MRRVLLALAGLGLLTLGCSKHPTSPATRKTSAEAAAQAAKTSVTAPFDLGSVVKQVHFAFQPKGAGFEGGDATFDVRVQASGAWTISPRHFPEGRPAGRQPAAEPAKPHAAKAERSITGAPLALGPAKVRAGGANLEALAGPSLAKDAHLTRGGAEVAEHLRNTEGGVEQSWEFAAKPGGRIEVEVPASGLTFAGETQTGLHFRDPATGLGIRYGNATWVDAQGAKTPLAARYEHGAIRLTVPREVVRASAFPATLDPTIGPEFGMDQPVYGPEAGSGLLPKVAFGGGQYLVVWQDTRTTGVGSDIYGARVSTAGTVLDPYGIPISTNTDAQTGPAIAYDGTNFFVAWTDHRNGNYDIYGARVSSSGTTLDPAGIALCTDVTDQYDPAVAFDGTNYLVVWHDARISNWDIYGTRVSTAGTVLDPSGLIITNASGAQQYPAIAFDGTNYLVVWQDNRNSANLDIYGTRVSPSGTVLDTSNIAISIAADVQSAPALAFDGTNYLVTWADHRSGTSTDIYGARVSKAGALLDSSGFAISTATADQTAPAVAFDGTNYLVLWQDTRNGLADIYGSRVSTAGAVLDSSGIAVSTAAAAQQAPAIAFDGTNYFGVWEDYRSTASYQVYGARITPGGAVSDASGVVISIGANWQQAPIAAYDGTNYLVVWQDARNPADNDIYGTRVSPTGAILDPSGIAICTASGRQQLPTIAFDGTNYLVAWTDSRGSTEDIYGARVSTAATVLDPSGIAISTAASNQLSPSVAYDGTNYLVVWHDYRSGTNWDVYGARVSTGGSVLDPSGIAISTATGDQQYAELAFDGTNYLVVWFDTRNGTAGDIYGARVSPAGSVLDAAGIAISTAADSQGVVTLAFDGTNYLVAWGDHRSGTNWDIYGSRVAPSGTVLDPSGIAISTATGDQYYPAVAFDGTNHLVVWQDTRSGNLDIYGARVSTAGAMVDSRPLPIATSTDNEQLTRVVSNGQGTSLVVYSRLDTASAYQTYRARGRFISEANLGQSCSSSGQCATGYCVDGVCCDSACGGGVSSDCEACSVAAGGSVNGTCTALTGTSCDDGNLCTTNDVCGNGVCAGTAVVCTASDACHAAGTCNPATGACSNPFQPDGTHCNDGNACTQTDTCQAGQCTGANAVVCTALDACHQAGTCDTATGVCSNPLQPDGTTCDDGNGCTQTDTCQSGQCTGANPVACTALDACHQAGSCDPATGLCSNPLQPDGTTCSDGSVCTSNDSCQSGTCVGGSSLNCDDGNLCTDDSCDPVNGCVHQANTAACDDGNPCTTGDVCAGGSCVGAPVVCPALDGCHLAGSCIPADGGCTHPVAPDDAGCDDGRSCSTGDHCSAGTCVAADTSACICTRDADCPPAGPCQADVHCDVPTGTCLYANLPDDAGCDDGNLCTTGEHCVAGACGDPASTVTCAAVDDCHGAGACDSATGACSTPALADGTACDGGTCQAGSCVRPPASSSSGSSGTGSSGSSGSKSAPSGGCGCGHGAGLDASWLALGLGLLALKRSRRAPTGGGTSEPHGTR